MSTKWIVGLILLFVLGSLIAGVCEMQYLGGHYSSADDPIAVLEQLFSWSGWINALPDLLWWNYAMFEGNLAIMRYILLIPISLGTLYGIFTLLISVVGSLASSITSLFRLR